MVYEYGPTSSSLEEVLLALEDWLTRRYRLEYVPAHRRSARQSRRLRRIRVWIMATARMIDEVYRVRQQTIPRIEHETGYAFRSPETLPWILINPSASRLFSGILAGFEEGALPVRANDLARLANTSTGIQALALIGDVTLRLKILPGRRVGSEELAALCDRWSLYENLIGGGNRRRPVGETLEREKAALAMAVLGLIYTEGGDDALRPLVPLLNRLGAVLST
jgi:hypothetical protein